MDAVATGLKVWHFAGAKLRDGRALPKAGDTLTHSGEVKACESGLHGSVRALDALAYAPGYNVALCELRGTLVPHGDDKHAASERHYLTGYVNAREVILKWCFAEVGRAVRVDTAAALRSAASADKMPDSHRDILRAKADDLERLPVVDSSAAAVAASGAAWAASDAAGAARYAAWAASNAAWVASAAAGAARYAAGAARYAAVAASNAAWVASDAAGAVSAAAGAASDAAGAARWKEANERLEVALLALLGGAR